MDTPKSLVPGSESGELKVVGGLALPDLALQEREGGGLAGALSSLSPIIKLKHLGTKVNKSERNSLLEDLPRHVSIHFYNK